MKHKNKFLESLLHNKAFMRIWNVTKFHLTKSQFKKQKYDFYQKNADRVEKIIGTLADEQSKKLYSGITQAIKMLNKKYIPFEYCDNTQYFIKELQFGKDEVFVDCGAYNGDTIDGFLKHCPEYKHIVAFEPETANFQQLQSKHKNTPNVTFLKAGAWHEDGIVSFSGTGMGASVISGTVIAGGQISVKSIDGLQLERVTFIKMDIEGAELNALKGAKETILRDKPKLAICLYHSDNDMLDIPEYIHSLVPEYKLYVRQHSVEIPAGSMFIFDTVLYALPY